MYIYMHTYKDTGSHIIYIYKTGAHTHIVHTILIYTYKHTLTETHIQTSHVFLCSNTQQWTFLCLRRQEACGLL